MSCRSVCQSILTAPGTCPTWYSSTSSSDSTMRRFGSCRCASTHSVETSTSGWVYSAAIRKNPSGIGVSKLLPAKLFRAKLLQFSSFELFDGCAHFDGHRARLIGGVVEGNDRRMPIRHDRTLGGAPNLVLHRHARATDANDPRTDPHPVGIFDLPSVIAADRRQDRPQAGGRVLVARCPAAPDRRSAPIRTSGNKSCC